MKKAYIKVDAVIMFVLHYNRLQIDVCKVTCYAKSFQSFCSLLWWSIFKGS